MSRIAAIVVTYNRKDKLRNCIEAIMAQDASLQPDIFIVDNGSTDGTADMIADIKASNEEAGRRLIYNNLLHNSGGAGGFCYGVRRAAELGYDYLWLMDDDCVPERSALQTFMRFDREHHGEYGFLSSKVLWRDGSPGRLSIQRETLTRSVKDWNRDVIGITMASFVSLFIPREVVMDVGLPVREFFIWTDDWEYTRRISRKYPCYLLTGSMAIHDMDTEVNAGADIATADAGRLDRFRYLYRNDVYLYRREGLKGFCYEAARLSYHLLRVAGSRNSLKEKFRRAGIIISGTFSGLRFYPVPDRVSPVSGE